MPLGFTNSSMREVLDTVAEEEIIETKPSKIIFAKFEL